jgi:hypothetical protein
MLITDLNYLIDLDSIDSQACSANQIQGGRKKPTAYANAVAAGDASGGLFAIVTVSTNTSTQTSPFGATAFATSGSTAMSKG